MDHTRRAWRTKSRGPKGLQLEVGAPRLLVHHKFFFLFIISSNSNRQLFRLILKSLKLRSGKIEEPKFCSRGFSDIPFFPNKTKDGSLINLHVMKLPSSGKYNGLNLWIKRNWAGLSSHHSGTLCEGPATRPQRDPGIEVKSRTQDFWKYFWDLLCHTKPWFHRLLLVFEPNFSKNTRNENVWLIPSQKIPGSQ